MTVLTSVDRPRSAEVRSSAWEKAWWLPLALILVVQAVLAVRLIPDAPLPSGDEGRYIYSGHELIYELWHGGGSPYYETYFSGAPVIYPILAAMVDHFGGLAAVRLMSLQFMLTATCLAFATTRRLYGYWPGITAAGLFASLGITQDLSVYATYDAMALMLIACAGYCAVRSSDRRHEGTWLLLVPLAILAANATKYVTIIFDPVVILLAALQATDGLKGVLRRVLALSAATGLALGVAVCLAGTAYVQGVMYSTLARNSTYQAFLGGATLEPPHVILAESWGWTGVVIGLGVGALIWAMARRADGYRIALLGVLVFAGLLVTMEALRLHSDQSMRKHDDFGAWFACIAAGGLTGYVRDALKGRSRQYLAGALGIGVVTLSMLYYAPRAESTYEALPSPSIRIAGGPLRLYLARSERMLLGGLRDDELIYADHLAIPWFQHFGDQYIKYPIPGRGGDSHGQTRGLACFTLGPRCMYLEGAAGYRAAIHAHWFTLVSMLGSHGTPLDALIEKTVERTPGYVLLTRLGGSPTWVYAPAYRRSLHNDLRGAGATGWP